MHIIYKPSRFNVCAMYTTHAHSLSRNLKTTGMKIFEMREVFKSTEDLKELTGLK